MRLGVTRSNILLSLVLCGSKEAKICEVLALEAECALFINWCVVHAHGDGGGEGDGLSMMHGGPRRALGALPAHSHLDRVFLSLSGLLPLISPIQALGYRYAHSHAQIFMWLLGIQIQTFTEKAFNSLCRPSNLPCATLLSSSTVECIDGCPLDNGPSYNSLTPWKYRRTIPGNGLHEFSATLLESRLSVR